MTFDKELSLPYQSSSIYVSFSLISFGVVPVVSEWDWGCVYFFVSRWF